MAWEPEEWQIIKEGIQNAHDGIAGRMSCIEYRSGVQRFLLADTARFIADTLSEAEKIGAEDESAFFAVCFSELNNAEKRHFIYLNMLESVKRGRALSDVVYEFHESGTYNIKVDELTALREHDEREASQEREEVKKPNWIQRNIFRQKEVAPKEKKPQDESKPGFFLQALIDVIKWFGEKLINFLLSVAKKILGELAGAVKPIVGFSGPWPTLSWNIDIDKIKDEGLLDIMKQILAIFSSEGAKAEAEKKGWVDKSVFV